MPSEGFLRNGHLRSSSQQAPQRLQSPRRSERAATISCFRKFVLTKRRIFPRTCRARSFASSTFRERSRSASLSSKERCLASCRKDFIREIFFGGSVSPHPGLVPCERTG